MIVVTFLGTVAGIPLKNRNHPAIAVEYFSTKKYTLLFDCGENTQKQLMKAGISYMEIDQIFITHWHADHFAGLLPLLATMNLEKRRKKLEVYGPEASKFVSLIEQLSYFGTNFKIKAIDVNYEGEEVEKIFSTPEFAIYSIPVEHTVPAVAYCLKEKDSWKIVPSKLKQLGLKKGKWLKKLKKLGKCRIKGKEVKIEEVATLKKGFKIVYTGDTKPCSNVVKISRDADLLIHDGTFFEDLADKKPAHASFKQAVEIAKKANAKHLILTNISRRYQEEELRKMEEEAKKLFPNAIIARDFMQVILKRGHIEYNQLKV